MKWTAPTFEELKMDAEIGSYQQDEEPAFPVDVEQVAPAE
jgi:hypothetical protein